MIRMKLIVVLMTFLLALVTISNVVRWNHILSTGSVTTTYASPLYGFLPLPAGLPQKASRKLGADFSCLYFAAYHYASGHAMYDLNSDPLHRPAVTFPPHLIWTVSRFAHKVDFPTCLMVSNYTQILLLLVCSAYYLWRRVELWSFPVAFSIILAFFFLFCTPVGTTWFERSQTDLFMASAYLLFLKGIRDGSAADFFMAGVISSLKWSALPFMAVIGLMYILFPLLLSEQGMRRKPDLRRIFLVVIAGAIPFLLVAPFSTEAPVYLQMLSAWEQHSTPTGISITNMMAVPSPLAKLLAFVPAMLYFLVCRGASSHHRLVEVSFLAAIGFLASGFGTVSYEYKLVSMLFLLPVMLDRSYVLRQTAETTEHKGLAILVIGFLAYSFRVQSHLPLVDQALMIQRSRAVFVAILVLSFVMILKRSSNAQ